MTRLCSECWTKKSTREKTTLVIIVVLLIILCALLILLLLFNASTYCQAEECIKSSARLLNVIDPKQNACENFYNFACGNYLKEIHDTTSVVDEEGKKVGRILKALILEPVKDSDAKSLKLQKLFYQSCTNLTAIEEDNDRTFWGIIRSLGGMPAVHGNNWNESAFDLIGLLISLRQIGLQSDWFFDISTNFKNGNRTIEVTFSETASKIESRFRQSYIDLMTEVAVHFGAAVYVAKTDMKDVLFFEGRLAHLKEEMLNETKIYKEAQKMTVAQAQTAWPKVSWVRFLSEMINIEVKDTDEIIIPYQDYLAKLDIILRQTRKRTQANYVMWKLIEAYAALLSESIRYKVANYTKTTTDEYNLWHKDRDEYCFTHSKSYFPQAIEATFLRQTVDQDVENDVNRIVKRIRNQLESNLNKLKWMDAPTKKIARTKLKNITIVIGGPKTMSDQFEFDTSLGVQQMEFNTTNLINITAEIMRKGLDFMYINPTEGSFNERFYGMVPLIQTSFLRDYNVLFISAAMLQGIFYGKERPNYSNYATIGVIVAHELIHSVDMETTYDGDGAWWSNNTLAQFKKQSECLQYCNQDVDLGKTKINCNRTLLENLAEYGGVNLAYEAYHQWVKENGRERKLPGMDYDGNQLFWMTYSSIMCHMPLPENQLRDVAEKGDHMVPSHRIFASYRNSPYFSSDFDCPLGSNMSPIEKCRIF